MSGHDFARPAHTDISRNARHDRIRSAKAAMLLGASSLASMLAPSSATAQIAGADVAPAVRQPLDVNGVNVLSGRPQTATSDVSIGPDDHRGLRYSRISGLAGQSAWIKQSGGGHLVVLNGRSDLMVNGVSTEGNGATLTFAGGVYTYTSADGVVARFASNQGYAYQFHHGELARLSSITYPDGTAHGFTWRVQTYCPAGYEPDCQGPLFYVARLSSVRSSTGFQLKIDYASDTARIDSDNYEDWARVTKVTAINNADEYCAPAAATCTLTGAWPTATYTDVPRDAMGRPIRTYVEGSQYDGQGRVATVIADGIASQYAYSDANGLRTTTVTDASGRAQAYVTDSATALIKSYRDGAGQAWTYEHDGSGRVTAITAPEGNMTRLTYDARGNITERRLVAKPGSGLADIVTGAGYEASCSNQKTCNKPLWTRDAKGAQTDYVYDPIHGGVTSMRMPAGASGVRPEVRYTYQPLRTYVRGAAGQAPAAGGTVYVLTAASTCRTTASCAGTADETRTTIDYGPQSDGVGNNLLPRSVTTAAGDGSVSATVAINYDPVGNPITVDGPLTGASDTTRYRFNPARELVGTVGADPDGAGPLKHRAARLTRDADGLITLNEVGTVDGQSDADWAAMSVLQAGTTGYSNRRVTRRTVQAGSATYGVTDYGYDAAGRLECTAVRMNPAAFGATPGGCSLGTQGSDGPDRMTKLTYDAAGRIAAVTSAFGTPDQSDDMTVTYTPNGRPRLLGDANGNLTTYGYDGFDRFAGFMMPSKTHPGWGAGEADFESYTLDANGNVISRKLRDGQVIGYIYDALNRLVLKDVPNGVIHEYDIGYAYDNFGRLTRATDGNGHFSAFGYDALGRKVTEQSNWTTRSFGYDPAGRNTRLTWGDGFFVTYEHDATGAMTAVRENGGYLLASFGYDDLGRRTSLSRGNGTVTNYGYDAASRPASLEHVINGSNYWDVSWSYAYNPAGQIASRSASHDGYAWTGHGNTDRVYQVNGVNQLTAAGAAAVDHDGRGNLTQSGPAGYGYTSESRLATAPGGHVMTHDPLGRFHWIGNGGAITWMQYDGDRLIEERDANGVKRRYVHGPGADEPLVWYEGSGTGDRRWLHADERGSVVAVTNSSGQATAINTYDEYGRPGTGNQGRFQYTGQKWIPELGLYDYKARMYSPALGRFMQPDPIGYADGMNLYGYVGGDPVNLTDPTGLDRTIRQTHVVPVIPYGDIIVNGERGPGPLMPFDGELKITQVMDLFRPGALVQAGEAPASGEIAQRVDVDKSCPAGGPAHDPGVQAKALDAANRAATEQQRNPDGPPFREYGFTGRSNFFPLIFGKGYVTGDIQRGYQDNVSLDLGWFDTFAVHTHSGATGPSPRDTRSTPSGFTNIVIGRDKVLRCYTGK